MIIKIDTREHKTVFTNPDITKHTIETTQLPVGDVKITDGDKSIIIELKKGADLFQSKLDGRLDAQIADLNQQDWGIMVFIGDMYDVKLALDSNGNPIPVLMKFFENYPDNIIGLKSSIALRVNFMSCYDFDEFQRAVVYWIKQIERNKLHIEASGKVLRIMSKKHDLKTIQARQIAMLSCAKGVGRKTAETILGAQNWSILQVLQSDEKSITKIKGIGKKTYQAIQELVEIRIETTNTDIEQRIINLL